MDSIEMVRQAHMAFLYAELAVFAFAVALCAWHLAETESEALGRWRSRLSAVFAGPAARRRLARQGGS